MVRIDRLRWNPNNVGHILRHRVRTNEVQEVVDGDPMFESGSEGRLALIGPTATGRVLAVILEAERDGTFFPVTARPASRKERRRYETFREAATP